MAKRSVVVLAVLAAVWALAGCARSPQDKEARFLKAGKAQLEKKDYTRAILQFKNAIQVMPKDAEAYYRLGLAYLGAGDLRTAAMCFRKGVELNPKHADAQLMLAQIMATSSNQEVLQDAAKRAQDVLTGAPDNVQALNTLATTELKLGRPDDAEKHLQEALQKAPASLHSSIALAKVRLSRRDVKGAEEVLKQAVERAPKSAQPMVTLGEFYIVSRRDAEAEQQFAGALKVDANNGQALRDLAAMQVRAGQNDKAEQTYRRLSQLPEKEYKPLHALFLLHSGKQEQAVAEFEKLAKNDPTDRDARARLVKGYLALNRVPEAEKILTAALKKNAKDTDALLERGKIYLDSGKHTEAQTDLNQVIRLRPDSAEAHYVLSKVYTARGDTANRQQALSECLRVNPRYLPARLELAEILIATKAAKSALNMLDEAPADQKKTPAVLVQRNWAMAALDDKAGLRRGIDEVLTKSRAPEVLIQDAALRLDQKDFGGARASLEEALKTNPEDLRALDLLVRSYAAQKQGAVGMQKVREYAARMPKSAPLQQFLGELLRASGNAAEARKAFEAAKAANPGFVRADLSLAELDMAEGKVDAARKSLSGLLAVNAKNVPARLMLAGLEETAGNHGAAIEHYQKALDQDQRNPGTLNNMAYLLAEYANRPDEALKYAQQAKEIVPDSPTVDDTLGWIYYRKGIYSTAVKHLEGAVANGGTALRKYHLAMAYLKAGDYERGQKTFEAAMKMDAKLPEAEVARKLLAEVAKGAW
jgi:tetratricopeptide (TPR) repeat protein